MMKELKEQLSDCKRTWCEIHGIISIFWFFVGLLAGMLIFSKLVWSV